MIKDLPKNFSQISEFLNDHETLFGKWQSFYDNIGNKMYECDSCLEEFSNLVDLKMHFIEKCKSSKHDMDHEKNKKFDSIKTGNYEKDSSKNVQSGDLRNNVNQPNINKKSLVQKMYACEVCKKSFRTTSLTNRHLNQVHLKMLNFKCGPCGKSFVSKGTLDQHQSVHNGAFVCDICEKTYQREDTLSNHFMESRAASTTTARSRVIEPGNKIKI